MRKGCDIMEVWKENWTCFQVLEKKHAQFFNAAILKFHNWNLNLTRMNELLQFYLWSSLTLQLKLYPQAKRIMKKPDWLKGFHWRPQTILARHERKFRFCSRDLLPAVKTWQSEWRMNLLIFTNVNPVQVPVSDLGEASLMYVSQVQ